MKNRNKNIRVITANHTFDEFKDHGYGFSNSGASGEVTLALPAAKIGMRVPLHVLAAYELRADPNGTETIALPSTGSQGGAGEYITANAVGEYCELVCKVDGQWDVEKYIGTWTAEAA